ncbi:hypothetical protein DTO282E5_7832 [Paecilomyces variotii]|nr:hypothetical protein DTO282E5_7832 [Paecilomyces variotii]
MYGIYEDLITGTGHHTYVHTTPALTKTNPKDPQQTQDRGVCIVRMETNAAIAIRGWSEPQDLLNYPYLSFVVIIFTRSS